MTDILPKIKYKKILMDNARIHHSKIYKKMMKISRNTKKTIYNVPYSPQYSPMELFLNDVKRKITNCCFNNVNEVITYMNNLIDNYDPKSLEGYFKHSMNILYDEYN